MANDPRVVKTKKRRSKSKQWPVWKFEIVQESSDPTESLWSKLSRTLRPLIDAAHDALGDIYATSAKAVLQRKEAFEDHRAEQKARQRIAARKAEGTNYADEIRLAEAGTGLRNGLASNSKSHA
jgi:hypothetical protein